MLSIVFETRPSDIQKHLLYTLFGVGMEARYPGCCIMKGGDSMFGMKIVIYQCASIREGQICTETPGQLLLPLDRLIGNIQLRRQRHVPLIQQLVARMHLRDLLQQPSDVLIVVLHLLVRRRVPPVPAARLCAVMHLEARLFIPLPSTKSDAKKSNDPKKKSRTIRKKSRTEKNPGPKKIQDDPKKIQDDPKKIQRTNDPKTTERDRFL
jgi:hypothetical protein